MSERLFGFDTTDLNLATPNTADLEREIKRTFGDFGFNSTLDFSLTQDA